MTSRPLRGAVGQTLTFVAVCATEQPRPECLAALPQAQVFVDPVLSLARNTALAVCEEEWIAYVDGDVVVEPGWAVPQVDDDVAVVSGPLRGAHDARAATFHGGNVAFRAPALRGVGGFWPARGHRFARDWFSEEHEAQRELARAGWRAVFDERMAARRLPSGGRLRRAARAGARRQLLGDKRSPGELLALAARGRPGLIAEALGGLLGARLAGRDVEPVVARTPFRPSVPMPATGRRRARPPRPAGIVLVYHRIVEREDPLGLSVAPARFAEQLEVLRADWDVVPEAEATRRGTVAITFDDGYADNLAAAELLAGLPASLFVCTGAVEERRGFWWEQVRTALAEREGPLRLGDRAWPRRSDVERRNLSAWLQGMAPEEQRAVLDELGVRDDPADRVMTIEELRGAEKAFTIGAHTRNHPSLAMLAPDRQRGELQRSKQDLEAWLGVEVTACAYPFGVPGADVSADSRAAAKELFARAYLNVSDRAQDDPWMLPRHTVPDVGGAEFARWLSDRARR
jgi:peptidoglycan/xylan/chitin deacetylase (PgdA/CDA1 family)